ncbi:immunoglobulin-like domain-containing protein [Microbacterium halophytorum]|uniref:immunoglobulin-like domain-containing protein n=1 Tax=Microbacterium halophytorum TaxID=2067568 RepID=UPI00131A0451|nr:immunoglobulin-like domain-containing protein [Microbacterium halophytorum]
MTTRSPGADAAPTIRRRRRGVAALLSCALAVPLGAFGAAAAHAVDVPAPTAHYDMSHSGETLIDVSGNGRDAVLTGTTDTSFVSAAGDDVLRFAGDAYAALPQGLVTGADNDFTVEYTVATELDRNQFGWVIGDGVGAWNSTELGDHVFVNPRSAQSGYASQVLSGIRVKTGDGNGEVRLPAGGGIGSGFATITMVGSGDALTVYVDGEQISTGTHPYAMSDIVPSGDVLGYLGRSLYAPDQLLEADVTDVKFWDEALTAEQLRASQPTAEQKQASDEGLLSFDIERAMLGANPALDRVTEPLSLPGELNGVALAWSSSDEAVVALDGTVSREIAEDTVVTLTAVTASGAELAFEVTVLAPSVSADLEAIDLSPVTTENLPLVVEGPEEGASITWASSDPDVVTGTDAAYAVPEVGMADPYAGGGIVTRPAYGEGDVEVTLTATASLGGRTETREFVVTVAERARTAPDAGYAAAYFKSDGDERIYSAATTENDFFTFEEVNGGQPVVDNAEDTTGHRDPYILRSHDGGKYYMIATDLCIGCGTSWGDAQSAGSLKINFWESTDMVHWERTNGDGNGGITVNQPEAGMTWAPEAYWDDELQSYVVFFASRLYDDVEHTTGDMYAKMFAVVTRDFRTFSSPPATWQDTGFARIDSTVQKIGDYYYRFTKNEDGGAADGLERGKDIFLERSKVLTAPTAASDWNADPEQTWQLVDTAMTNSVTGHHGEGPQIAELNEGDPNNASAGDGYVFLVDNYSAGGYRAFVTSGEAIASSSQGDRLSQREGWTPRTDGLPASPRHGSFVSAPQQVLDAMHSWSDIEAVASETALSADGRTLEAAVSATDGGEVAGTVTFSGSGWSEQVALSAGAASVEVPEGVASVTARYDGYRDGLVAASESAAVDLGGAPVEATAATRCVAGSVVLAVTVSNTGDEAVSASIATEFGERESVRVAPGASRTAAFSTRLPEVAAGEATATVGAATAAAGYPAASCR